MPKRQPRVNLDVDVAGSESEELRCEQPGDRAGVVQGCAVLARTVGGQRIGKLEQTRSGQDGVNLDEEAARLIQYQQSYQAAAKVLQVAQSLFETVLDAAGR